MADGPEDDWFSEPDVRPTSGRAPQPLEDDWLARDELVRRRDPPFELWALADRRLLAAAGAVVAVLLAALAAAGVFGRGAERKTAPLITTTVPKTTPTSTAPATRPVLTAPARPLVPGDSGAQVERLQRALARLGYSAGAVDGRYGPATEKALAAFQRAYGLSVDGILGPKTLQALTRALGR